MPNLSLTNYADELGIAVPNARANHHAQEKNL
jgi:hypothetical protein